MKMPADSTISAGYRIWLAAYQARAHMIDDGLICSGIGCDPDGYFYFRVW
jgi:hypothetical protein